MGDMATVTCIDCLALFEIDKRFRNEANICPACVRKYIEKHGTRTRPPWKRKGGDGAKGRR